jgi:hypothetical protein
MHSDKQDQPTREALARELFEARAETILDGGIPSWKPEGPETVRGWIAGRDTRTGNYGPVEVLILKRRDTGKFVDVYCGATALAAQVDELNPRVGEEVVVAYLGKVTSKQSGRDYGQFRLLVHRDDDGEAGGAAVGTGGDDDGPADRPQLFRDREREERESAGPFAENDDDLPF